MPALEQIVFMPVRKDEQDREFLDIAIACSAPSAVEEAVKMDAERFPTMATQYPLVRVARVVIREVTNE